MLCYFSFIVRNCYVIYENSGISTENVMALTNRWNTLFEDVFPEKANLHHLQGFYRMWPLISFT